MEVEIVWTKRKSMVLQAVSSERAVLKAPIGMPKKYVEDFLNSKLKWLEKNSKIMAEKEKFASDLCAHERAYLRGKCIGNFSDLIKNFENMSEKECSAAIRKFYRAHFCVLKARVKEILQSAKADVLTVKPTVQKTVWGVFSSKKEMKLNIFLVCLPDELIDYVIVHELCHSFYMNHGPKFWAKVESYLPDYKQRRQEIKKYSSFLTL